MATRKKKGLGKGLGALIAPAKEREAAPGYESAALADGSRLIELDPHVLRPNPKQPRRHFDEEALQELAESIRNDGVQEPVIVRQKNGDYELVSGERRVRASILAEQESIPAVCRDVSDQDMLKFGLIENIQREDLNAIELAQAYQTLVKELKWTQQELAAQVGKSRVTVTNVLRLLNLPAEVQRHLMDGAITSGHARALLALDSPAKRSHACRRIIEEGLSVRQAEKLASPPRTTPRPEPAPKDPNIVQLESDLQRRLGTRVRLKSNPKHKGRIEIEFYGLDDLERILALLGK